MSQQQHNHRNKKNRNHRNKKNDRRNRTNNTEQKTDKKVPMRYQVSNSKDPNTVELKYTERDGAVDKTKLNIFEDGSDEEFLKLVKEFQNHVDTYRIWEDEHAAHSIYKNFRRCLAGSARDLWDQIIDDGQEERDELVYGEHLIEFTKEVSGNGAVRNQKKYLTTTSKPEKMSVKQWISRIKNINSYIPFMKAEASAMPERDLINDVITPNIPTAWEMHYHLQNLHLKTRIRDIIEPLTVIEEQVKKQASLAQQQSQTNNRNLKNPCKLHNGSHEWDDCCKNPKNAKNNEKDTKTSNGHGKTEHNGRSREQRPTERNSRRSRTPARSRSSSHARYSSDSEGYEHNCIAEKASTKENEECTQSSEILIALPNAENSKKYTTYLGLINSGSSGSLLSSSLIENTNFNVEKQKKPTKWDTATGVLLTKGRATIEALSLPQFTRKRQVSSTFHLFEKRKDDQYDIILSRDFLQAIGLVIDYSASQFTWDNISVAMVPSGYWMKEKITSVAITWNKPIEEANNEMPLTEILPAEYKPVNIEDVVKQQTHLSVEEQEQLQIVLFEYQDLFKGQCRKYNGDPVSLELIPGSKPYYGKPFSIPKA
jgi:hypothetical protein